MVVINIYGCSTKSFILFVSDGEGNHNMQAIIFFLEFYFEYMQLVQTYSTRRPTTFLVKNVRSATHGGQQLLMNDELLIGML
jgi:hypothetical protein